MLEWSRDCLGGGGGGCEFERFDVVVVKGVLYHSFLVLGVALETGYWAGFSIGVLWRLGCMAMVFVGWVALETKDFGLLVQPCFIHEETV